MADGYGSNRGAAHAKTLARPADRRPIGDGRRSDSFFRRHWLIIVAVVAVVVLAVAVVVTVSRMPPSRASFPAKGPAPVSMGNEARDGALAFTLKQYRLTPSASIAEGEETASQTVTVYVSMTNQSDAPVSFDEGLQVLYDGVGGSYQVVPAAKKQSAKPKALKAGQSRRQTLVFRIAAMATPTRIVMRTDAATRGVTIAM